VYRFLAKPRWLATTFVTLLAIGAFCGLGNWQWQHAKTRDTVHVVNLMAGPSVPVKQALGTSTAIEPGTQVRPVTLGGQYDGAHQLLVPGRTLDGRDGTYVLTPLQGVAGLGPTAVVVLRGWVPGRPTTPPAAPTGDVTLTGWLAPSEQADGPAMGTKLPLVMPRGQVATVSAALILSQVPYRVVDGYVGLIQQTPASTLTGVPAPPPPKAGINWSVQSLSYAFEWWFFALAAVWMWVTAVRREGRGARAPREQSDALPRTTQTGPSPPEPRARV
jgi:cytochrome oxidase assembly protein ShyY1